MDAKRSIVVSASKPAIRISQQGGGNTWGTHFLIQYWTYAATGGSNMKWEAHVSNGGAGHHWIPAGDDPEYQ